MAELVENIIYYIVLSLVGFILLLNFSLIWYYISKKPLGKQTMYDKIIKDLLVTSGLFFVGVSLPNLDFGKV